MSLKKKTTKKLALVLSAGVLGASTLSLTACYSIASQSDSFYVYNPTNFLQKNNSPLNASFTNAPISSYAQTEMLMLVDYQTTGKFKFSGDYTTTNIDSTTHDYLTLSAASALIMFKDEKAKDTFNKENNITETATQDEILAKLKAPSANSGTDGTDYWIFTREKGALKFQDNTSNDIMDPNGDDGYMTDYYKNAINLGSVYQFVIDTNNTWIDSNGNAKQSVSSKDFERAFEAYYLSSELNYNRNGYFLDLLGLDFDKTVGDGNDIISSSYNVENYKNNNDAIFTMYLSEAYPYGIDLLSKDYFAGMPYTNQKVKNTTLSGNSPIKFQKKENKDKETGEVTISYSILESETEWSRIYGSGGTGVFTDDTWYAGAYYISDFTKSIIVFKLNPYYMKTVGKHLLNYDNGKSYLSMTQSERDEVASKRIETINLAYGFGSTDTYYENFKSGQANYVSSVPNNYKDEAAKLFSRSGLVPTKQVKIAQSNYITYTPQPYTLTDDGKFVRNDYITENFAKFDYAWNSKESTIIRAGIAGLLNHYLLSTINLPGSGDFQLSSTPYGVFSNYYENVLSDNQGNSGSFYGGLPRNYLDYKNGSGYILDGFKIPYYTYSSTGVSVEEIDVNQTTFKEALRSFGASESNPIIFSAKFGEGSFDTNYRNYLNSLSQQIQTLSGGLISFKINERNSTNPSADDWYKKQASPLGYSYWSPDYNGVGTWIEADTTLQNNKKLKMEGIPSTNAHNGYLTYLSSMVTSVKMLNSQWDETTKQYTIADLKVPSSYKDSKIELAFSDENIINLFGSESSLTDTNLFIKKEDSPMTKYAKLGVGLLNKLIEKGVFDQEAFKKYVDNPSLLNASKNGPESIDRVYIGYEVVKSKMSGDYSKWLGVYAGSPLASLYLNTVLDSDYSYIPRSEAGVSEFIYMLVSPQFVARNSTSTPVNYRDYSKK